MFSPAWLLSRRQSCDGEAYTALPGPGHAALNPVTVRPIRASQNKRHPALFVGVQRSAPEGRARHSVRDVPAAPKKRLGGWDGLRGRDVPAPEVSLSIEH
ncbi:hypothetical protein SBV1_1900002 [Verrucomicrobia bacterium]|nr:hypothetical protein SBV1_1900002 [Verrucomicrobiota bacterium]